MLETKSIEKCEDRESLFAIYETAKKHGLVIDEKIQNPKENELLYYEDILGKQFKHSPKFISEALIKWIPALNVSMREKMAGLIFDSLEKFRLAGKNENMLKNAYIKFMCWFYYRFRGVWMTLESGKSISVVCSDKLGEYDLAALGILAELGCDVLVLTKDDIATLDREYDKRRADRENELLVEKLCGGSTNIRECVNTWMKGDVFSQIKLEQKDRGSANDTYFNVYCRISGVDDKDTYVQSLFEFYSELQKLKRKVVIVNEKIELPSNDEIMLIKRQNSYKNSAEMMQDLVKNLDFQHKELNIIIRKAYIQLFREQAERTDITASKLQSKMVYLLCWIKRYQKDLFAGFDFSTLPIFIKLGGSKTKTEALFMRYISLLPIDELVLKPDLPEDDLLSDDKLYELKFEHSMVLSEFPVEARYATVAYNAEQDLSEILYQGTGLYRDRQYKKANSVILRTMMEEIEILWDQGLQFRQGFAEANGVLNIPTVFAKLSGVPNANAAEYWSRFSKLVVEDSILVTNMPYISAVADNPIKPFVTQFYKNGRLYRDDIKSHKNYPYGILREETQEYILDKLSEIIKNKLILGIGENGTEYTVLSVVLNLPKEVIRLIQKFDFTKKNPKLVYVNAGEKSIGPEDSILAVFLNLIGFDVVFLVPTGYRSIEKYFVKEMLVEHQIGEYMYGLEVPDDFGSQKLYQEKKSWRGFFGLGGK